MTALIIVQGSRYIIPLEKAKKYSNGRGSFSLLKEVSTSKTTAVARLYKRSNSTIKKALKFTTKRNKAKLT